MEKLFKTMSLSVLAFAGVLLAGSEILQAQASPVGPGTTVKVMTYNINEGSDFTQVFAATNFAEFVAGAQATRNEVVASNPPLRMEAIAHQIAVTQPDLVGLQEVTTWLEGPLSSPFVMYDMLQELEDALAARGLHYHAVAVVPEFQLAGPLDLSMSDWLFANDSDVILARTDNADMHVSNAQWAHFHTLLPVQTAIGSFTVNRGWGAADVTLHGSTFRFVVTHLENFVAQAPLTLLIQEAQAKELVDVPAYVDMPVIIAGDFNADANRSDPTLATYKEMLSLGFSDAWGIVHPNLAGQTWQLVDSSPVSTAFQRIDYIFFSNANTRALTSREAGNQPHDKVGGLWPSDHAGVRAELQLEAVRP